MKSAIIVTVSVFLLVTVGLYFLVRPGSQKGTATSTPTNKQVQGTSSVSPLKFLDSKYARYAFKIFPGPLGQNEQAALTGFDLSTRDAADGSTVVSLTPLKTGYKAQEYNVKPGYSLYFIETSMGDDPSIANVDTSLGDDTAILIDPQGYLVK